MDITEEFRQHFDFKLADGYSEQEIAAKLGDPKTIAEQYGSSPAKGSGGERALTVSLLAVGDLFFGMLCLLLYAFEVVIAATAVTFGALSVCLIGDLGRLEFVTLPQMPYSCAIALGVVSTTLCVLSVVGAIYFSGFLRQLIRSYCRFHKNALSAAAGRGKLPSIPAHPQFSQKKRRALRWTALVFTILFAVSSLVGYGLCAAMAGSAEFWHVWGWFV